MKKILIFLCVFSFVALFSQEEEKPKEGWKKQGNFSLLLNQSAFANWIAGGENALAGNLLLNYDINFLKNDWIWDNKLIIAYGLTQSESKGTIKTDDRFEFNSLVGKKMKNNWSISMFLNFLTQFTNGYDYTKDLKTLISKAFAPAYLSFGPGLLWKKSDDFKINITPITSKITIVTDEVLSEAGAFGVTPGDTFLYQLGFNLGGYHKIEVMKNVTVENILNLFSNYLKDPQNIDIGHQLNLVMKVNKYITANLNLHTIYDDDTFQGMQFKEVFGVGLNYTF